ncbi:MAG: RNA 2',3'-cyclic phosphodiesterase [candidate division WOR-3 bacterium]
MSEKVRSFVAVDTSEQVKSELARLIGELKVRTQLNVKWVKPEQMHLTLVFLGEVSLDFIQRAKIELGAVAQGFGPFDCRLKGLGGFPSTNKARVLWAGLEKGEDELKRLQSAVAEALKRIGYVPEKRPFSPHLTLGRLREPDSIGFIQGVSFASSNWLVKELILFKSELKPTGPVYTKISQFPLKG